MTRRSRHLHTGLRRRDGTAVGRRSTRRGFLLATAASTILAWLGQAHAQAPGRARKIGVLAASSASDTAPCNQAFQFGLRDLGWIEGKNVSIEYRYAEGNRERLPELVADLVRLNVEVIVTSALPTAMAAKKATTTIRIVMATAGDPVAAGLVQSLSRPGGTVTGMTEMAPELTGKRLALLKEILPKLSDVAVLWNPQGTGSPLSWKELQLPAQQLGVRLHSLEVRSPDELDKALEAAARARVGAIFAIATPAITSNLERIAAFAAKNRLPSMFPSDEFADVGGLVTYGPDRTDMFRRAASYVDKILKGVKPGEIPIEQPTKFELVINLKTAKALGITIPQSVLVRADRVIE